MDSVIINSLSPGEQLNPDMMLHSIMSTSIEFNKVSSRLLAATKDAVEDAGLLDLRIWIKSGIVA